MADLFYRNPRLLILTLLMVVASGLIAYAQLPRQEDPTLTPRFGLILTRMPGATSDRVESLVTEQIERELRDVEELKKISSTSRPGVSAISVEIHDTITDVERVWTRVRDRLADVAGALPVQASVPELREREQTDAYTLIAALRWESEQAPNYAIMRRVALDLRDRLRDVSGTSFVKIFGAPTEEIRVDVRREALARAGLSASDIAQRIGAADSKQSAGVVRGPTQDLNVEVSGELDTLDRIRRLPVRVGTGNEVVRLGTLASIRKATREPADELALIDAKPGIAIASRMQVDRRTDQWAIETRAAIEAFSDTLPPSLTLRTIFDQSRYVESRLHKLQDNLLLGVLLVIGVVFLLMGWRSALVVGISLPLSMLMVLSGLRFLGVPVHQMSITGLIIALGLLIDNAIIMVDEVGRRTGAGIAPQRAVKEGVTAMAVPLLGSTLTTVLAFMPMIVVPGPMGEFVGTIAVSVILALFSSLFLALTVVPTLLALLDRRGGTGWLRRGITIPALRGTYRSVLGLFVRHPLMAFVVACALPVIGFAAAGNLNEQFFPSADRDQIRVEMRLSRQSPIAQTRAVALAADALLRERSDVTNVYWLLGRNAPKFYYNLLGAEEGAPHYAEAIVQLSSHVGTQDVVRALQARFDRALPEAQVLVRQLEQGPPFEAPIEMRIFGPDLDVLAERSEEARRLLSGVPYVTHTRSTLEPGRPKLYVRVDEEALRGAGLRNADVADQLRTSLEGALGGTYLEQSEELPVRVRLPANAREQAADIASVDLIATGGDLPVSVSAVSTTEVRADRGAITRRDGRRVTTVRGYLEAGVLPAVALASFRKAIAETEFDVPGGYRLEFGGEEAERNRAVRYLMGSVLLLSILMIGVLVLSFRSFRLTALLFLIGALSAGMGLLSLFVFGHNFGFMAIVGIIGLVGIALNDAIAVLAGLQHDERAAVGEATAVVDVVERSTRHVLSTTITTIAGFLPLLLAGGGFWPPLAIAIAGGVAGSSFLALFFLPSAYRFLMRPRRSRSVLRPPEIAAATT